MTTRLFIHGIGCRNWQWDLLYDHLPGTNFRMELPGHGANGANIGLYDFVDLALTEIHAHGGIDVLIGHSMGGIVGLLAAVDSPELIGRLVILDSSLHTSAQAIEARKSRVTELMGENWFDDVYADLSTSIGTRLEKNQLTRVLADLRSTDRPTVRRAVIDALSLNCRSLWSSLSVKTMYVETARAISARDIEPFCPNVTHLTLQAGHWPHMEIPSLLANNILRFEKGAALLE